MEYSVVERDSEGQNAVGDALSQVVVRLDQPVKLTDDAPETDLYLVSTAVGDHLDETTVFAGEEVSSTPSEAADQEILNVEPADEDEAIARLLSLADDRVEE